MMSPTATIQLTTMELVSGKPKGRAISTAFCDRPCSSSGTTGRRSFCPGLPWLATPLAEAAETTSDETSTANVKTGLKPTQSTARNTLANLVVSFINMARNQYGKELSQIEKRLKQLRLCKH